MLKLCKPSIMKTQLICDVLVCVCWFDCLCLWLFFITVQRLLVGFLLLLEMTQRLLKKEQPEKKLIC